MFDKKKLTKLNLVIVALVVLVLIVLGYLFYSSKQVRTGPQILLNTPEEGIVVNTPTVEFNARLQNVDRVTIHDRNVDIGADGLVSDRLVLQPGENTFEIKAYDRLGQETSKEFKIIFKKQ